MELTTELLDKWMAIFAEKIEANKAYLSDLDTPIGDGDHGNNMARGMSAVEEALQTKKPADLTSALKLVAMSLISKVGGASGPLYGTAFLEMAKLSNSETDLARLTEAALLGIKKRGGAEPGDKTMCDVWVPVVESLRQSCEQNLSVPAALDAASSIAESAAQSTITIQARKGRASYLGERSIGHQDPGATSVMFMMQMLALAAKE